MSYTYQEFDTLYDLEVLSNFLSGVMYRPYKKAIYIAYSTHFDHSKAFPKLTITEEDRQSILKAVKEMVHTHFPHLGIEHYYLLPESTFKDEDGNVKVNTNKDGLALMTKYLMDEYPDNEGTQFSFNGSFYDSAILTLFKYYYKQGYAPDAYSIRSVSDNMIVNRVRPQNAIEPFRFGPYNAKSEYYRLRNHPYHIDIRGINEKMTNMSQKRQVAQLGGRIQTSNRLKGDAAFMRDINDVIDLLVYNVSDSLGVDYIFQDATYQNPFATGTRMVEKYQDTRFKEFEKSKRRTMKRDTTSANFIEAVIAPTTPLTDDAVVSLAYPIEYGYIPPLVMGGVHDPETSTIKRTVIMGEEEYDVLRLESWEKFHQGLYPYLIKQTEQENPTDQDINETLERLKHTVPFVAFNFYYGDGSPKVQSVNHQLTPLHTNRDAFQEKAKELLLVSTPEMNRTIENTPHEYYPKAIRALGKQPTHPDYHLFYGHSERNPRVVYKDQKFQIDLLEWFMEEYHMDEPYKGRIYEFYNSYRGRDMNTEGRSTVSPHLERGADVILPYDIPVYARVSIGGIHGNIIDLNSYLEEFNEVKEYNPNLEKVIAFYTNVAQNLTAEQLEAYRDEIKNGTLRSEKSIKSALEAFSGEDIHKTAAALARQTENKGFIFDEDETLQTIKPWLYVTKPNKYTGNFKKPKKLREIGRHHTVTLDAYRILHADVSSYYPTIITTLEIFKTGDYDPYQEILQSRLHLKSQLPGLKAAGIMEEFIRVNEQQDLDKLLLNAASGKADATIENNIQVRNKIHRMRISGQIILLTLALDTAKQGGIPNSINTDGIYVHNIDQSVMEELTAKWCQLYRVSADVETLDHFVSKSSNERMEVDNDEIVAVGGGQLSYYKGVHLKGAMDKPAITNYLLAKYLKEEKEPLKHFDHQWMKTQMQQLIQEGLDHPEKKEYILSFFQQILAGNPNKNSYYLFQENGEWVYHSPVNRVFWANNEVYEYRDFNPDAWISKVRLLKINKQAKKDYPPALEVAEKLDLLKDSLYHIEPGHHPAFTKIPGLDGQETDQLVIIENEGLWDANPDILNYLDLSRYIDLTYMSWLTWADKHVQNYGEYKDQVITLKKANQKTDQYAVQTKAKHNNIFQEKLKM